MRTLRHVTNENTVDHEPRIEAISVSVLCPSHCVTLPPGFLEPVTITTPPGTLVDKAVEAEWDQVLGGNVSALPWYPQKEHAHPQSKTPLP